MNVILQAVLSTIGLRPRTRLSVACLASLFATFEVQVGAGIDILTVLRRHYALMHKRKRFVKDWPLLALIISSIQGGHSLAEALRPHLNDAAFITLSAGELGGQLVSACKDVLALADQRRRLLAALREALLAPATYLLVLFVTLYIISNQTVPALAGILPVERWQGAAAVIYQSSRLVSPTGIAIQFSTLTILVISMRLALPRWVGPYRIQAERFIPGFGLYRDLQGALWLGAFATLLKVGVTDTHILEIHLQESNPWLSERLRSMLILMRNGFGLGDAMINAGPGPINFSRPERGLKFDFPSPGVIDDIAGFVGYPGFDDRLLEMRDHWLSAMEQRLRRQAKRISAIVQTAIFVYFGVFTLGVNELGTQMGQAFH